MNIIDTNAVQHILKNNLTLQDDYFLVPDVEDEVEMTEIIHKKHLPDRIFTISKTNDFDEGVYLKHYRQILNKYGGRSFYNMTGFGDVSILATLLMFSEISANQRQTQLFQIQTTVYSDDAALIRKVKKELVGKNILVCPARDIS